MKEYLGEEKLIICNIGSGGNISDDKDGKSIETSMGFTPNTGIVMGTFCGLYDDNIILYMIEKGMSANDIDKAINKESGFYGIRESISDAHDIEDGIASRDEKSILA